MTSETALKATTTNRSYTIRKISFYILFLSFFVDCIVSHGATMMHLTLWSVVLHTFYFELSLTEDTVLARWLHGPSFSGAHALLAMYLWTLVANPSMEFQLAPTGRATWLIYARAFWLHFSPVLLHWMDIANNKEQLRKIYQRHSGLFYQFWASVGGYFAMGLSWEQINGDSAATYQVDRVSPEVFVNVSKALGIVFCILSFWFGTKNQLMK